MQQSTTVSVLRTIKKASLISRGDALQKAIELNPLNANYHYVFGQLLEDWTELEGAWDRAIGEFTRTIELNPITH